jgi:membrane associated rhomboid family serine protease
MMTETPGPPGIREPALNVPAVVLACIGVVAAIHALRSALSPETDARLLFALAFIPAQWTVAFDPSRAATVLQEAVGEGGRDAARRVALAQLLLRRVEPPYWSVLTYAVLHGSWAHVILNGVWLAAFGTPVARRCGAPRFVTLAVAAAIGGAAAHLLAHRFSVTPMVGASAAVSGMMAAAAWFAFGSPHSSVAPGGWLGPHDQPRQSIGALLRNGRAALFVGVWFATNLLFGVTAAPLGITDAGIAWEAHIGGFLIGLALFPALDLYHPLRPRPR